MTPGVGGRARRFAPLLVPALLLLLAGCGAGVAAQAAAGPVRPVAQVSSPPMRSSYFVPKPSSGSQIRNPDDVVRQGSGGGPPWFMVVGIGLGAIFGGSAIGWLLHRRPEA